jgi:DNA-binding MarR family transcriptional regulator
MDRTTNLLDISAVHLLHRASQCANELFAEAVSARHGLTPRQLAVLAAVSDMEGASQTDIVHKTGIDRSTLADIVRRMLRKGLLERRRTKEDARAYAVRLSDSGRDLLSVAGPAAAGVDESILAPLPQDLRQSLLDALTTLAERAPGEPSPHAASARMLQGV